MGSTGIAKSPDQSTPPTPQAQRVRKQQLPTWAQLPCTTKATRAATTEAAAPARHQSAAPKAASASNTRPTRRNPAAKPARSTQATPKNSHTLGLKSRGCWGTARRTAGITALAARPWSGPCRTGRRCLASGSGASSCARAGSTELTTAAPGTRVVCRGMLAGTRTGWRWQLASTTQARARGNSVTRAGKEAIERQDTSQRILILHPHIRLHVQRHKAQPVVHIHRNITPRLFLLTTILVCQPERFRPQQQVLATTMGRQRTDARGARTVRGQQTCRAGRSYRRVAHSRRGE